MKLTTLLIFGVFTVGSACSIADHRDHHGHRDCGDKHHRHAHKHGNYLPPAHRGASRYSSVSPGGHRNNAPAENYARVIHVEPVYRYYSQPVSEHSCIEYESPRSAYNSHTATVLGAVIGTALGHRIGDAHGDPKAAAVAGGLLGATVGRDIGHRASYNRGLRVQGPCRVRSQSETRRELVEYRVTYRYNGQTHYANMDYDPGEWLQLDVSVTPA